MDQTERRQPDKEQLRRAIIQAASEIIIKDGYESLSIRKVARQIGCAPSLIYHYFASKADLVSQLAAEGYGRILARISQVQLNEEQPELTLVETFRAYIDLALESPLEYRAILLSDIESIREQVQILPEGIAQGRNSLARLAQLVQLCVARGRFRPSLHPELTAQIIWTSTFGLLARLLIETAIPAAQRERLIDHHFDILLRGLLKRD